jgi:hypothetical protein
VLDFYGLDALMPQTWTDLETLQSPMSPAMDTSVFPPAPLAQDEPQPQPQQPKNEWEYDDSDPLGIKESVFGSV